jgi:transposase-like protein
MGKANRRKVAGPRAHGAQLSTSAERGALTAPDIATVSRVPDPEVAAKPTRRQFTAEYKLRILREAESEREVGAIGALLRREGLYSTHLTTWRHQRESGALAAMTRRRRGRKPDASQEARQRLVALEAENTRLQERLRQAEAIIEAQKKLSEILPQSGVPRRESA